MTKQATKEQPKEPKVQTYVILKRLAYKAMIPEEREIIVPAPDPYAPDAPRRTFDHLSKADIQRLVMRKCIAPYEDQ
jgi:hypothetical protein